MHSRLGPRASIQSRLGPRFEEPHEQPSRQSIHSRLGPQRAFSMSLRRMQRDARREAATRSASSSTGNPRRDPSPARQTRTPLPQRRQICVKPSLQVHDLWASGLKWRRSGGRDVRPLQSSKFGLQIFNFLSQGVSFSSHRPRHPLGSLGILLIKDHGLGSQNRRFCIMVSKATLMYSGVCFTKEPGPIIPLTPSTNSAHASISSRRYGLKNAQISAASLELDLADLSGPLAQAVFS